MNKGSSLIIGAITLLVIGNSPSVILPFMVGSIEDQFNLTKQGVGNLMTLELSMMAISSIFFSSININLNFLLKSLMGITIVLLGYFITSITDTLVQLYLIRIISGLACGLLISSGHSILASNPNPEKSYAFFSLTQSVVGALIIYISGIVLASGGFSYFFISLGSFYLLLTPSLYFLRNLEFNLEEQSKEKASGKLKVTILLILGVLLFEVSSGGMWAFNERLGIEFIGITVNKVGLILALSTLSGLLAPPLVLFIGDAFGRKKPIIFSVLAIFLCFVFILKFPSYSSYFIGNIIWYFFFTLTVIYVLAATASISPSGRLASWLNASILVGMSLSPSVFGFILEVSSFENLLPFLSIFIAITLICIFLTKDELDKTV